MIDPYRLELAIRTILVTWRAAMRQIRAGYIADSAESARATGDAQRMLAEVASSVDPSDTRLVQLLLAARAEVDAATADDESHGATNAG
jgi:hypothetical protein